MPSRADVEAFAEANRGIRALVLVELRRFWAALNTRDARTTRDALLEFVPLLVAQYGEIAAAAAADFYEQLREQAEPAGTFAAVLALPGDEDELRGQIRWSIGPLFSREPEPDAALGRLEQKVDEFTLQPGRDTIAASASADPAKARWARVPVGETCAFCLLLASRGAVYRSAQTAGEGRKFHGSDDCVPTPFWGNEPYPEGYNPDALYEQYDAARKAADSGGTKAILSELRKETDGH